MTGPDLEDLATRALGGDTDAVEALVRAVKDDVYNLAMRMLGHPADAEDATQEILVKVVTRLASFRREASLRTWVWRIASNHLLSVRRGRREVEGLDFEALDGMLAAGLRADVSPPEEPERAILEEEVKLGCTQSMLACLDREHRLAFILADVFDLSGEGGLPCWASRPRRSASASPGPVGGCGRSWNEAVAWYPKPRPADAPSRSGRRWPWG